MANNTNQNQTTPLILEQNMQFEVAGFKFSRTVVEKDKIRFSLWPNIKVKLPLLKLPDQVNWYNRIASKNLQMIVQKCSSNVQSSIPLLRGNHKLKRTGGKKLKSGKEKPQDQTESQTRDSRNWHFRRGNWGRDKETTRPAVETNFIGKKKLWW